MEIQSGFARTFNGNVKKSETRVGSRCSEYPVIDTRVKGKLV